MSYQNKDIIVTPEFFQKHSDKVTVIPPKDVYSLGGRGGATRAVLADCAIKECECTVFKNVDRFISPELKRIVEENNLFTFGYAFDCMKRSFHIHIFISTAPSVTLKWYKDDVWASLIPDEEKDGDRYLGMIKYSDCGQYSTYRYNDHVIKVGKDISFSSSRFKLEDLDELTLEVIDDKGLGALAKEIATFIQSRLDVFEPEKREGVTIFATPDSELTISKDMLAESGSIELVPDDNLPVSGKLPKDWPYAKIVENIDPFVTEDFKTYLDSVRDKYFVFAIDNGICNGMSAYIPVITVVIVPGNQAKLEVHTNFRASLTGYPDSHYGEVKFYPDLTLGGYRVTINGSNARFYGGIFDTEEKAVRIDDPSGYDLLELKMRRGKL